MSVNSSLTNAISRHIGNDHKDYSVVSGDVAVYFRNLESHLVSMIQQADAIVGCVAWLTSEPILRALAATNKRAAIIVQKEDFLRPDSGTASSWKAHLHRLYSAIRALDRRNFDGLICLLSQCSDTTIDPVRCVGNHNSTKNPAFPRMHNKFLIFCKEQEGPPDDYCEEQYYPYAVWTGSFNLTANATKSLENAVVLRNSVLVQAYFNEWQQIASISESLDWESDWIAPEWRLGT